MRLEITNLSREYWPVTPRDQNTVADAIMGTGWSVEYHEAPDYQASLMIMADRDDRLSTFVVSSTVRFRLQECQGDVLWLRGEFRTLGETITALLRAMANKTASWAGETDDPQSFDQARASVASRSDSGAGSNL